MAVCGSARAEDVSVTFIHPTAPPDEATKVAEVEMFGDRPALLAWRIMALPGSKVSLRGQVFQSASSLAVPLRELAFEVKTVVAEGRVQTDVRHSLALPETGKPGVYVIQWQAVNGEAAVAAGAIRLRLAPRGILAPLQSVSLMAEGDWKPLIGAFERDQVKVVSLEHAELLPTWQGVLFAKADTAMLEKIKTQPLAPGQSLVVFGDLPGMRGTILMKPAGRGQLMVVPASRIKDFPTNPALQRLVVEFCQSVSP